MARCVICVLALLFACVSGAANNSDSKVESLPGVTFDPIFDTHSGYLNATSNGREQYFFYMLTKSQSKTAGSDPLILWLNGGPGCSSLGGLFEELGPYHSTKDGKGVWENPYAWNKVGHVIYLESPAGVGYSYSVHGDIDTNDDLTADANYAALLDFLEQFPEFENRSFYITGESYGGVYIPTLAERVVNGTKDGTFKANFKGMAIGNGILSAKHQQNSVVYLLYYRGAIGYKQFEEINKACCDPDKTCNYFEHLKAAAFPRTDKYQMDDYLSDGTACGDLAQNFTTDMIAYTQTDPFNQYQDCYNATGVKASFRRATWQSFMSAAVGETPVKPYLNFESTDPFDGFACWDDTALTQYLQRKDVLDALHVSEHSLPWLTCNNLFGIGNYTRTYYDMSETIKYVAENNVRVLIYNGDVDWVCNFLGDEWFMRDLANMAGLKITKDRAAWHFEQRIAGYVETYQNIDLLTVKGSGHFVPTDRPGPALQMIANFIQNTGDYSKAFEFTPSRTTTPAPTTTTPAPTTTAPAPTTTAPPATTKAAAGKSVFVALMVALVVFAWMQ